LLAGGIALFHKMLFYEEVFL
jgi:hypothetical protein